MLQKSDVATKIDVEKAIELAVEKLQEEIKSSHNDIVEKLDEISGDIKSLSGRTCCFANALIGKLR